MASEGSTLFVIQFVNLKENIIWCNLIGRRPRWLSWMRSPTGGQEVAGSTPAEVGNIIS